MIVLMDFTQLDVKLQSLQNTASVQVDTWATFVLAVQIFL